MPVIRSLSALLLLSLAAAAPASARRIDAVVAGPPNAGRVPVLLGASDAKLAGAPVVNLTVGRTRVADLRLGDRLRVVTGKLGTTTSVTSLAVSKRSQAPTFKTLAGAQTTTADAARQTIADAQTVAAGQVTTLPAITALRIQVNLVRQKLTALAASFETVAATARSARPRPGARRDALAAAQEPFLTRLTDLGAAGAEAAKRAEETSTALDNAAIDTQRDPTSDGGLPIGVASVSQLTTSLQNLLDLLDAPCTPKYDGRVTC